MPPMSRRLDVLTRALSRVRAPELLLRARARIRIPYVTVLTYHRIAELGDSLCDPDVVDATPEQFDWQMRVIADYFSVISTDQLISFFDDGEKLPPNPCLITFDDGYRDCHDIALPILQSHSLRATFFIATDYVDQRRVYWWDRINYLMRKSEKDRVHLSYPHDLALDLKTDLNAAIRQLLRLVKDEFGLDVNRFLDELARAVGVPGGDR